MADSISSVLPGKGFGVVLGLMFGTRSANPPSCRLESEHPQGLRLGASTDAEHLYPDDSAVFVKVQDHAGLNFFGIHDFRLAQPEVQRIILSIHS